MKTQNHKFRISIIGLMVVVLSHLPNLVLAESLLIDQPQLIPTSVALQELTREQSKQRIEQYLQNQELQQKLANHGLSPAEIQTRLQLMSDAEINDLSQQLDQAQYGGDIIVTVLLIVLIIFLVKRI